MGFLDNTSITVDAILTKTGRERLSQGTFQITKFSLSDEEIDYTLYDTTHPNGTDSYGAVIENMNLLEAHPNRVQFTSHLVNQALAGAKITGVDATYTRDALETIPLNPSTDIVDENYIFSIGNLGVVRFQSAANNKSIAGKSCMLVAQDFSVPSTNNSTTVTITGAQSGTVKNITVTVNASLSSDKDSSSPLASDPVRKSNQQGPSGPPGSGQGASATNPFGPEGRIIR